MNPVLRRVLMVLIAVIVPFFLMMTAIRLLFTPLYPQVEYHMPGFPADPYGFTLEDRLHWSRISIEYLLNNDDISYLADQHLPGGQSLYNERELSHMVDVKRVFKGMVTWWWALLVVLAGLGIWAWRARWLNSFLRALGNGGKLTLVFIALILFFTFTGFDALFTYFHELFFTGNSWIFLYSDTLIRLFPLQFWQDAFITVGVITILGAVLLIWIGARWGRRNIKE